MEDEEAMAMPLIPEVDTGDSSVTVALVFSSLLAQCGAYTCGCTMVFSSPVESGIMSDLNLSDTQYAIFVSVLSLGAIVGALACGKTADSLGRKRTMWLSQLIYSLGWLAIIFAKNEWWLYVARIFLGFGVGTGIFVVPIYVAEIAPKNLRGLFASAYQLSYCVGTTIMYSVGTIVNWRTLAVIASIPGFLELVGLFFILESPRWLAKVGREDEMEAVIQKLRGKGVDISIEAESIKEFTRACESLEQASKNKIRDLFQRKYARLLVIGCGLMIFQQFSGETAFDSYATAVFEYAGFSTSIGNKGIAAIQIPAALFGIVLMDICGRRPLLMISTSGMCLSCAFIGAMFLLQDYDIWEGITPILIFVGALLTSTSYALGLGIIPYIIMSEIFPINVKGIAGSFLLVVDCIAGAIVGYAFLYILEWNSAGLFFIFATICAAGLLFVIKLVPETKCKTIEEIQESMIHSQ